jgi:hypothetical protein
VNRVACVVALAALSQSARASAQETLHTVTFAWARGDGADQCPTQASMMGAVRARLGRDPFSLLASVSAEASVERANDRWRARLIIRNGRGEAVLRRELDDASAACETIAGAVVVSVTLALAPPPAGDPTPAFDPERAPPVRLDVAPVASPPVVPPPPRERARTSLGGEALWGPLPEVAPGVVWRLDAPVSQRFAVFGAVALTPEQRTSDARFAFGMTRGAVGLCARAHPSQRFELDVCAGLSLGLVHVVTFGPTPVEPGNYAWFAGQLEGHALARVAGPLFVDLGASVAAAVIRSDFVVAGPVPVSVFAQSPVALAGAFAVGVEF